MVWWLGWWKHVGLEACEDIKEGRGPGEKHILHSLENRNLPNQWCDDFNVELNDVARYKYLAQDWRVLLI